MSRDLPVWRSFLFVPVLNERFVQGAPRRGADAVILDLEDAIPPADKARAREALPAVADDLAAKGCEVVVRINRPWLLAIEDMKAAVRPEVSALVLPKVPGPEHLRAVAEILDDLERERGLAVGHTRLVAMIETAEGLLNAEAIAAAHERVVALTVGAEDLAVSLGMRPTHRALLSPNLRAVAAARAAGCLPIGYVGTVAGYGDREAFADLIAEARELGFVGGFAIHPDQIAILNRGFSPSEEEIEEARALVATFEEGLARGLGAIAHKGRMVDLPVVEQSRAVLRTAEAVAARSPT